ncbi:MAG: four helix bundle protein [Acidimicrobiia bacterium]
MQDFRSLRVWQESHGLALEIYELTSKFPTGERFGLTAQMRRAAVSVSSNIAEGCSRSSRRDFARFLEIALGSAFELEVQLELAVSLRMVPEGHGILDRCNKTKRSIVRLIKSVRSHPHS